jgi:exosortase
MNSPIIQPSPNSMSLASPDKLRRRVLFFSAWVIGSCLLFLRPLSTFFSYSLSNDNASHLVLIPAISAWLLFLERNRIFRVLGSDRAAGAILLVTATTLSVLAFAAGNRWSVLNLLTVYILALILVWIAGFAFFFGRASLKAAQFGLVFLLFTIPIPDFLLDKLIYFLQKGTTEIAAVLFDWSGVPILRDGFVFHLAHVSIEVARECSGIRSSLALLILAILVAHFYLDTFWKQAFLVLLGLFVMVLKNGVRIVTLTLLATYVDPGFLYGKLHRQGGVVFFLFGLLLMWPILWLLQRSEPKRTSSAATA